MGEIKNKFPKIISIILLIVIIIYFGYTLFQERETILSYGWKINLNNLFLFTVFHSLAMMTQFLPWHLAMVTLTGNSRLLLDLKVYSISLISRRIPMPIWYIGSRFVLYKELVSLRIVAAITGFELILIGLAGLISYIIFLPFYSLSIKLPWQLMVGFVLFAFVVLFFRPKFIFDILNFLLSKFNRLPFQAHIRRKNIFTWLVLYIFTWLLDGTSLYFWIKTITTENIRFIDVVGISTVSALVSYMAQFLPSGFALREISISALLNPWIPISIGVVIAISYRLAMIVVEIVLTINSFFLDTKPRKSL